MSSPNRDMLKITPADLSFEPSNSTAVISEAHKFIIPVPKLGEQAEPLVYPAEHPQAGQPIVDYKGRPVGERGLVFFNQQDQAWQAVPGDGSGVIIVNEVAPPQAVQLDEAIRQRSQDIGYLTAADLKEILHYASTVLGLHDVYNSTRTYVQEKLVPAASEAPTSVEKAYGFMKRKREDLYQAIYIPEQFIFEGPAETAQVFAHGGVIIEQQGKLRGIQPEVFVRTYRLASGQSIQTVAALKTLPKAQLSSG
ncbi:MAG: hypothetical protein F6J97_03725 [Leptolyngbya sp. SIO4C1]|nr:hypothetical protein [Leptolyngbya sp. SIO4C1]